MSILSYQNSIFIFNQTITHTRTSGSVIEQSNKDRLTVPQLADSYDFSLTPSSIYTLNLQWPQTVPIDLFSILNCGFDISRIRNIRFYANTNSLQHTISFPDANDNNVVQNFQYLLYGVVSRHMHFILPSNLACNRIQIEHQHAEIGSTFIGALWAGINLDLKIKKGTADWPAVDKSVKEISPRGGQVYGIEAPVLDQFKFSVHHMSDSAAWGETQSFNHMRKSAGTHDPVIIIPYGDRGVAEVDNRPIYGTFDRMPSIKEMNAPEDARKRYHQSLNLSITEAK